MHFPFSSNISLSFTHEHTHTHTHTNIPHSLTQYFSILLSYFLFYFVFKVVNIVLFRTQPTITQMSPFCLSLSLSHTHTKEVHFYIISPLMCIVRDTSNTFDIFYPPIGITRYRHIKRKLQQHRQFYSKTTKDYKAI